jgi:hypothetical protein
VLFLDYVAVPVMRLIAFEVLGFLRMFVWFRLFAAVWHRAFVAVLLVVVVVDMTMKILRTVKPRTSSDENTSDKPLGAVVAVRSTRIRWIVVIAIGAIWSYSDVDTNLRLCSERICGEAESRNSDQRKAFEYIHIDSLLM